MSPQWLRYSLVLFLALAGCAQTQLQSVSGGPDCRPMVAKVVLSCWYGGRDTALSRCEVGREEPVGCGLGTQAIEFYNSGLDLSGTFYQADLVHDTPRWVQFNVYRDATGRVGRKYFRDKEERLISEAEL